MPNADVTESEPAAESSSDTVGLDELAPPPSLSDYAGRMLKQRLTRFLSHSDGVREGHSTAPVHQMRVWSRRTRAALELFRTCYEGSTVTHMEREIKRVADALGEARDLDVMIETMTKMGESLPENQRGGVESFSADLRVQRAELHVSVDQAVERLQKHDLGAVLEGIIAIPIPIHSALAEPAGSTA